MNIFFSSIDNSQNFCLALKIGACGLEGVVMFHLAEFTHACTATSPEEQLKFVT